MASVNRRRFERFQLPAAYTEVKVCHAFGEAKDWLVGHAYDVSEAGIRIELDEEIPAGSPVRIRLTLPVGEIPLNGGETTACEIEAEGTIVWADDDDAAGPVRLAASFARFPRAGDRERLIRRVVEGRFRRAA